VGGDWRPAGRGQEAVRTRRARTKRKSREAACGTPGRAQKEAPPTPAIDGRPKKNAGALGAATLLALTKIRRSDGSHTKTRSRRGRRWWGVRAQMCLAVAPPRQARRVRSAIQTSMRSLLAPVADRERPSTTAPIHAGASRGRPAHAEGVWPDRGWPSGEGIPLRVPDLRSHALDCNQLLPAAN
jgi:hypothetical protein